MSCENISWTLNIPTTTYGTGLTIPLKTITRLLFRDIYYIMNLVRVWFSCRRRTGRYEETIQSLFNHSFIHAISIVPLQVHYYSEAFPTQHGYCVGVSR